MTPASGEQERAHVSNTPCPRCGVVRLEVACAAGPGRCPMGWEADATSSAGVVVPADTIEEVRELIAYLADEPRVTSQKYVDRARKALAALAAVRAPKEDEA